MEKQVNERVKQLITQLKLTRSEFSRKTNTAMSTYDSIMNGKQIYPKTIEAVITAYNLNREWVMYGKGKMFAESPKDPAPTANPATLWQDATYKSLQDQIAMLKQTIAFISEGKLNFLKPSKNTDPIFIEMINGSLEATA